MDIKKAGKPPINPYQDDYPEQLKVMMADGALDCNICTKWSISRDTFYRWIRENPKLKEAHDVGLMACESWWVDWGMQGMRGDIKGFSFNAWIAFMNNKFKWAKNALTDPSNVTNNISITGNINVLNQLPREDLISQIQMLGNKNKDILNLEYIEIKSDGEDEESDTD